MPMVGGFLGGGVEMVPAGYATVILQWNTWDGQNVSGATFTLTGPQTYTVSGNSSGYAVQTVLVGTYTVSVAHTGTYQGDASKSIVVESTQSYYLQFYGAAASVQVAEGAGISITQSGNVATIGLKSGIVSAGSVGGSTQVPVLTFDTYGRCTSKSYQTIYPPTTAGTAGQVWMSDGSGQGYWGTADGSPAISNEALGNISLCYAKNSRLTAMFATVTWSVNKSVLNGREGRVTIAGTVEYSSSLSDTFSFSVDLTNSQMCEGIYAGYFGSPAGSNYTVRSFSGSASISY